MIHFDDVLSTAHAIVTEDSAANLIEHVLVLRDLRGRLSSASARPRKMLPDKTTATMRNHADAIRFIRVLLFGL